MKFTQSIIAVIALVLSGCGESTGDGSGSGQAGSLASMVVANDRLHILHNNEIVSFDLSEEMVLRSRVKSSSYLWSAETLFNYNNEYLLVGTDNSVQVFTLHADEEALMPVEAISEFSHLTAKDPVVAYDGVAYYTTRDGDESALTQWDVLGVLDISDITAPTELLRNNSLKEPYGLTILNDDLFVCDKAAGLTQFNIIKDENSQVSELTYQASYSIYPCNDVVAKGDTLILIDPSAINQLRVTSSELELMSKIDLFY